MKRGRCKREKRQSLFYRHAETARGFNHFPSARWWRSVMRKVRHADKSFQFLGRVPAIVVSVPLDKRP